MYSIFTVILCIVTFAIVAVSTKIHYVCGSISARPIVTVVMHDGVLQSEEDFEKLQTQKLKGATLHPEPGCAIQICGFSSYSNRLDDSLIGSLDDFSGCWTYEKPGILKPYVFLPSPPYNELFNASSISCSCRKDDQNCSTTCSDRQRYSIHSWEPNECALLFPEKKCNSCSFSPVSLETNQSFSTNHTIHISTIQVRNSCVVYHKAPAFKKYYWFQNQPQPSEYWSDYGEDLVVSAYDVDPETFTCQCGVSPNDNHRSTEYIILSVLISAVILSSIAALLYVIIARRKQALNEQEPDQGILIEPEPDHDTLIEPDIYGLQDLVDTLTRKYPNCLMDTNRFSLLDPPKVLGKGCFGKVYLGRVESPKIDCAAIKKLFFNEFNDEQNDLQKVYFMQEIEAFQALAEFPHENIVKFFGAHVSREGVGAPFMAIITEFCNKDTLKKYMENYWQHFINLKYIDGYNIRTEEDGIKPTHFRKILQLFNWAEQIASGMKHLHSHKILHGDLATRNMLLMEMRTPEAGKIIVIKLCDFGLSVKYRKTSTGYIGLRQRVGPDGVCHIPAESLAPEVQKSLDNNQTKDGEIEISRESDVWAFGGALAEIFSQCQDDHEHEPCSDRNNGVFNRAEQFLLKIGEKNVFDMINYCRKIDPEGRPKFEDLWIFFTQKFEAWHEKVETAEEENANDN